MFDRLQVYIQNQERNPPPKFIGRQDILDDLCNCLEAVGTNNPNSMTRIVQGVPGAGKTSLCAEFIRRNHGRVILGNEMVRNPDKTDAAEDAHLPDQVRKSRVVLCLEVMPDAISGPPLNLAVDIRNRMLAAYASLGGEAGRAGKARQYGRIFASVLGAICRREQDPAIRNNLNFLNMKSGLSACLNAYAKDLWKDDVIIALCVDEMQNCGATSEAKASLNVLHNVKHGARIAPLFFGLPHTERHIRQKLKLSRLNTNSAKDIGSLQPGEGGDVIDATLKHLGVDWDNPAWRDYAVRAGFDEAAWIDLQTRLADAIETEAHDFPQHLTAGIIAICQTLQNHRKELAPESADALIDEAQALHLDTKIIYYEGRLSSADLTKHRLALGAICRMADLAQDNCVDEADAVTAVRNGTRKDMTEQDAEAVLKTAVGSGLLVHMEDYEQYGPPNIPSMQTHLIDRLMQDFEMQKSAAVRLKDSLDLQLQSAHSHEP